MKERVLFTAMKPKTFEVDIEGIEERIKKLNGKRNFNEQTEFHVLSCFKSVGYCLRSCNEFYTVDIFSRKSCLDCLRNYVKEVYE